MKRLRTCEHGLWPGDCVHCQPGARPDPPPALATLPPEAVAREVEQRTAEEQGLAWARDEYRLRLWRGIGGGALSCARTALGLLRSAKVPDHVIGAAERLVDALERLEREARG